MKRARLFEKMPTDMETAEAVTDTSRWPQLLLPGFTSDLQPPSELPLASMVDYGIWRRENGSHEFLEITFNPPVLE